MKSRTMKLAASLILLLAACGGDDATTSTKSSPTLKNGELACGSATCTLPKELQGERLCCKDAFSGKCGIKGGDSCRDFPKVDDRCPVPDGVMTPSFPGTIPTTPYGCCTEDNVCGVDTGMPLPGQTSNCMPRTGLCNFISKADAPKLMPTTCDGEAMDLPANCGRDRGGFGRGPMMSTGSAGMSSGSGGSGN